jgi:hypothetical protein
MLREWASHAPGRGSIVERSTTMPRRRAFDACFQTLARLEAENPTNGDLVPITGLHALLESTAAFGRLPF